MRLEGHPAGDNIVYLRQGIDLVRSLDDPLYRRRPPGPYRGGVGSQFRHCLDFYLCFLEGHRRGRVDYGRRRRDAELETDRERALTCAERIVRDLERLDAEAAARPLEVRSELSAVAGDTHAWSRSSVNRELQFLVSHTIHHYALIVALLRNLGHELTRELADFGVAPSTLAHWKQVGTPAG